MSPSTCRNLNIFFCLPANEFLRLIILIIQKYHSATTQWAKNYLSICYVALAALSASGEPPLVVCLPAHGGWRSIAGPTLHGINQLQLMANIHSTTDLREDILARTFYWITTRRLVISCVSFIQLRLSGPSTKDITANISGQLLFCEVIVTINEFEYIITAPIVNRCKINDERSNACADANAVK